MTKSFRTPRPVLIAALLIVLGVPAGSAFQGTEQDRRAQARTEFDRGREAASQKQPDAALAAYRRAIELDPALVEAHEQFVSLTIQQGDYEKRTETDAALRKVYDAWVKAHPKVAALHYFLGRVQETPGRQDEEYLKTVALDPKFAKAYQELAFHADMRGDRTAYRSFLKKAADAAPDDESYAFYYAFSFDPGDKAEWTRLSLDLVKRFPTSERAAQALYWLGVRATNDSDKLAYLQRLKREFPPQRSSWSRSGMEELFDAYGTSQPEKALALAREMTTIVPEDSAGQWKEWAAMQQALVDARHLLADGRASEALALLEAVKPPKYVNLEPLHLALVDAECASGQADKAYKRLAGLVAAEPTPTLYDALMEHARQLERGPDYVAGDLAARRDALARPTEDFEFSNYLDGTASRLSNYRGKVVLLNFWYPG